MSKRDSQITPQTVCALIEMESMAAANYEQMIQGKSLVYGENEFKSLIAKYGLNRSRMFSCFHKCEDPE